MTVSRRMQQTSGYPQFIGPRIKHTILDRVDFTAASQFAAITLSGGSNTGSRAADTTSPLVGGQTSHVRFSNSGANGSAWSYTPASPWDLSDAFIRVTIRIQTLASSFAPTFRLATNAASYNAGNYRIYRACAKPTDSQSGNWFLGGTTWVRDSIVLGTSSTVGTGANLASIGYIVVNFQENFGQTSWHDIARFERIANASTKAKCVIWHDDSLISGMTALKTKLDAYGFPAVEATEWDNIGGGSALTTSNLATMKAAGWQLATHAATPSEHTTDTQAGFFNQARRSKIRALQYGYSADAVDFGYWGGQSTTSDFPHISNLYRSGRFNTSNLQIPDTLPPSEPGLMKAVLVNESTDTFTGTWQPILNNAIAIKGIAQFVFHQGAGGTISGQVDSMLTWLDANRSSIDVVTIADALASSTV